MTSLLFDARLALRAFRRSPGFYATVLVVLVAGIGSATAMLSIAESLLLRPLPYAEPGQLTVLEAPTPDLPHPDRPSVSLPDFLDWKASATTFEQMAAISHDGYSLTSSGAPPENIAGTSVSGDYFPMFRLSALRGRLLGPEDDKVGAPPVVVISAALWHRRFGSDPSLVGRAITLGGRPHTVLGVAPEGFELSSVTASRVDLWTPLAVTYRDSSSHDYAQAMAEGRGSRDLEVMGRRKPGVTLAQSQAQLSVIARQLETAHPDTNAKMGAAALDMHEALVESSRSGVWVLFGAVLLVFVVVCANVANLLLTRAQARRGEMATRAALGASPARLAGQVIVETVVLFGIGAIGGSALAFALVDVFAYGMSTFPIVVGVDGWALATSLVVCLACGALAGLVPALAVARVEPQSVLQENAARAGVSRAQVRVRGALAVAQVAVAFALLVGSGLAVRAFAEIASRQPGFDPTNVTEAFVDLTSPRFDDEARLLGFYRDALAAIAAAPGVQKVAVNSTLPMAGGDDLEPFDIEGKPPWPPGEGPSLGGNVVTPGYFATMAIPRLRGRDFTDADRAGSRLVVILSETAAKRFFPGEDPVGRRIHWERGQKGDTWREIVGVVADVRHSSLEGPIIPEAYVPLAQVPQRMASLIVRSSRPEALMREIPAIIQSVDAEQAVWSARRMTDRVERSIGARRHLASMFGAFGVLALVLATLGVFGLVSYTTSQRTRELGIRMALGSNPGAVVGLVLGGGARILAAGLGLGVPAALAVAEVVTRQIPGVPAFDALVYGVVPAVLGVASLAACALPAWRAVRTPPATALRYE